VTAGSRLGQQRDGRGHDHRVHRKRRERRDLPGLGLPLQRDEPAHVQLGHRADDQRQQGHISA
jgi:hypothetical protein